MCTKDAFNDQKYNKNKHRKILIIYSYDAKLKFQQPLLQSSASHDPSEIILTCWFGVNETYETTFFFIQDWIKDLENNSIYLIQ